MKTILIASILVSGLMSYAEITTTASTISRPERVNAGYVACSSAFHLQQYEIASTREQMNVLLQEWCMPTADLSEYPFVVLNSSGTKGVEKIRLFLFDDETADVFVNVAAVTKGK